MLDDIVKEFLVESYENLDQLDRDLMALEETPDDRNRLSSIFRTIHTIKGTSGFLAFPKLEHVTHVGENLLVRLRDGELRLNAEITTGLLAMVDAVRAILGNIEAQANEGEEAYDSRRTADGHDIRPGSRSSGGGRQQSNDLREHSHFTRQGKREREF